MSFYTERLIDELTFRVPDDKAYSAQAVLFEATREEKDYTLSSDWSKKVIASLNRFRGKAEDDFSVEDTDQMFEILSELILEKRGGLPKYFIQSTRSVSIRAAELDVSFSDFLNGRFAIHKPNYGAVKYVEAPNMDMRLRGVDTSEKFTAFTAVSIATYLHTQRFVCNPDNGFLSRLIIARAMIETMSQNRYVSLRLLALCKRIENWGVGKAATELDQFRKQFFKAMYGSRSSRFNTDFDPYNSMTCIEKLPDLELWSADAVLEFYEHLCDYTHPNFGMRSVLFGEHPTRAGYFHNEIVIPPNPGDSILHYRDSQILIETLDICTAYMADTIDVMKEIVERLSLKYKETKTGA